MVVALVLKESEPEETRVASTPDVVKQLIKWGLDVQVEADAGTAAGFPDDSYRDVGAKIAGAVVRGTADLVLGVHAPEPSAISSFKRGAILVAGLQPLLDLPVVKALATAGVDTFAMDLMPRITRAQKMDVLSSQANIAGYQAVLMAADALPRMFPLMMTAAGTIRPAKVLVLGAGVAGLQAIATARRLGAVVEANDIRPEVKEQVESLGAKFVDTGTPPKAQSTSGYASETPHEYQQRQRATLTEHMKVSDVVITTALIPGKKAPLLVADDMVAAMRPGSVILDMAVEMGGNVEGSEAGKTVKKHGVTILGEPNLPGRVAADSSQMFARNIAAFLELVVKEGKIQPDWEDEVLLATVVTRNGEVAHGPSAEAIGGASKPAEQDKPEAETKETEIPRAEEAKDAEIKESGSTEEEPKESKEAEEAS